MSVIPDLQSLDTTAARLNQQADELRTRSTQLQTACASATWQSSAATAFRQRSDSTCSSLRHCADRLEHAAFVLRRHAATARSRAHAVEHIAADIVSVGGFL